MASEDDKIKFLNEKDDDTILLFTNGKGEPKAINVDRCIDELDIYATPENSALFDDPAIVGYDEEGVKDFLLACPRVPLLPISFEFSYNSARSSSNFEYVDGFQFSYQTVYKNGSTSAIAPYSDIAYPPSIIDLGTSRLSETNIENECRLFIPDVGAEANFIRIIVRQGNNGNPRVIDEIGIGVESEDYGPLDDPGFSAFYNFYNDKIGTILSEIDALKTFDNVPRNAHAQTVADNRVMYGNYTEGYPNLITDVDFSVEFKDAPPPGFSFDIKVVPYIFSKFDQYVDGVSNNVLSGEDAAGTIGSDEYRWKTNTGFLIDTSGFPSTIPAGTYNITVSVKPNKNFHVYLGSGDARIFGDQNAENEQFGLSPQEAGTFSLTKRTRQTGRQGSGHHGGKDALGRNFFNGSGEEQDGMTWVVDGDFPSRADVGHSYSNPLIIDGAEIETSTTIKVVAATTRDLFSRAIVHGLCGLSPNSSPISTVGVQEFPTWAGNEQAALDNYFKEVDFNVNLPAEGSTFSADNDALSSLITTWSERGEEGAGGVQHPQGFFILSKGKARFVFEPATGYEDSAESGTIKYLYGAGEKEGYGVILSLAHLKDVESTTVVPIPEKSWSAFPSVTSANLSTLIIPESEVDNGTLSNQQLRRARRYAATNNGQSGLAGWNIRYDEQGNSHLSWPSCVRQWESPDGSLNGPACLQFASEEQQCYGDSVNGIRLAGSIEPTIADTTIAPSIYPGDDRFHPAPIDKWLVLGGAHSDVTPDQLASDTQYWQQKGFSACADVPGYGQLQAEAVVGSPNDVLGEMSKYWCGYIAPGGATDDGTFRLGRDIPYSLPASDNGVDAYKSRGTFSVIDGDAGVGGQGGLGAKRYGGRDNDSVWGSPLFMGYNTPSNIYTNGVGRLANTIGSVTNFSLLGYKDNVASLLVNEVIHKSGGINLPSTTSPNYVAFNYIPSLFDPYTGCAWTATAAIGTPVSDNSSPSDNGYLDEPATGTIQTIVDLAPGDTGDAYNGFYALNGVGVQNVPNVEAVNSASYSNGYLTGASRISNATFTTDSTFGGFTSYKTKANHEFGLVYYDERGRHGAVQPLPSVYVPGYDFQDRGNNPKGAAKVVMTINHAPPEWAKNYRVVYGGNTSVREFVQYTAAGAFAPDNGPDKSKIYVSLNHLQNSEISYADSYGAISQDDNSKDIYKFTEGDRLRVISYTDGNGQIVYPEFDYDFRVLSYEILIPDLEDHPFDDGGTNPRLNGDFLVLEDNQDASGFSLFNIQEGDDFWGNRCVFEVYRPFIAQGEESRAYYETNYGGSVRINDNGDPYHQYNVIKMTKGDVFFRGVPTNVQPLEDAVFTPLLPDSNAPEAPDPEANFTALYLESDGVTDLYISKSKNYGRIHFADRFANEVDRQSSISFSEQTPLGTYDLRYFSFPQIGNFKDLPPTDGQIDKMTFEGTHIMSFNNSRLYMVPVSRDTLTVSGVSDDAIVASAKVLGTERAIPFDGGSSGRPESVVAINNDFFFFDAVNERLVMVAGGKSPVIISDINVGSYFREEVKKWKAKGAFKAPAGYDPIRSEFVFSLHDENDSIDFLDYDDARDKMITMAFDLKSKKYWKTRYTFTSAHYAKLNECLISFHKPNDPNFTSIVPWRHEKNAPRNKFFGRSERSTVCIAANENQSKVKEFNVLVLDSDARWEANMETKTGKTTIPIDSWKRFNDKWYQSIDGFSATENGRVSKANSSDTTLKTMPAAISEKKTMSGAVVQTQYLGPKYFDIVQDANGFKEIEVVVSLPATATVFGSPLPVGKKSVVLESDPSDATMVPLGTLESSLHNFDRRVYIHGETKSDDPTARSIVFRMPYGDTAFYCATAAPDVLDLLNTLEIGDRYEFDESQNNPTGHKVFDIIFAPFYSTQFGESVESIGNINNLIAIVGDEPIGGGFLDYEYDLNNDGQVNLNDLLAFLLDYGSGETSVQQLSGILNEFGADPAPDGTVAADVINDFTQATFNAIYSGSPKSINVAYASALNVEQLTGRYMKIELISNDSPDDDELFEVGVDYNTRIKSMTNVQRPARRRPARRR